VEGKLNSNALHYLAGVVVRADRGAADKDKHIAGVEFSFDSGGDGNLIVRNRLGTARIGAPRARKRSDGERGGVKDLIFARCAAWQNEFATVAKD